MILRGSNLRGHAAPWRGPALTAFLTAALLLWVPVRPERRRCRRRRSASLRKVVRVVPRQCQAIVDSDGRRGDLGGQPDAALTLAQDLE